MDDIERKVLVLQRRLTLAMQLMTSYQRKRLERLMMANSRPHKTGRPKEFKGHLGEAGKATGGRIDVC